MKVTPKMFGVSSKSAQRAGAEFHYGSRASRDSSVHRLGAQARCARLNRCARLDRCARPDRCARLGEYKIGSFRFVYEYEICVCTRHIVSSSRTHVINL